MSLTVLDEDWIRANVKETQGLQAAKVAFEALGKDTVTQPPVMQLAFPDHHGETCIKSAHLKGRTVACVKVASGFYDNPSKGLPSGSGLMLLLDATTGTPLSLLRDGGYLTDLRTGAAGALACDLLCPRAEMSKIAIIGSGIQARFQLRAISKVRDFKNAQAYSPNLENLKKYCDEMSKEFKGKVEPAASVEECVRDADVIVTTTTCTSPIVQGDWVKQGCTIIAMGSDTPGKNELAVNVLQKVINSGGKIICDKISQCVRLGEVQHLENGAEKVHGELGEVLNGKIPGREKK